jgi:RNA polymerase sigma-54 factor
MRFETSQHMHLGQQMKLAPRMIQSMEILQLPMVALQERIEQELEANVALEQIEPGLEMEGLKAEREEARRDETQGERELVVGDDLCDGAEDFERLSSLESTYSEAYDNEYSSARYSASRMKGERDRKLDAMANITARSASLTEQLQRQWALVEVEPDVAAAGSLLIEHIDDDGLLSTDLESVLQQRETVPGGVTLTSALLERTVEAIQHLLEPPGIGARTSQEAVLIQIDDLVARNDDHDWTDARLLVERHFDDLLENRLPRIVKNSGLTLERIHEAKELLSRLKPHPGRELVCGEAPPIIPDVIVELDDEADEYVAHLSNGLLPTLRVSRQYSDIARDRNQDKRTRDFAGTSVRNANWLIDAIKQRNSTLLRVIKVVLQRQRDYFDNGDQHLKPLPMVEVADQLGVHVGTVSRAVAEKWMQTPRGLVPLRRFFSGGTETESGESMSWAAVKAVLQEIIDAEDKSKPLSDEALVAELKKRGIQVARRTVVKYRQQLDIPPARRRKVFE